MEEGDWPLHPGSSSGQSRLWPWAQDGGPRILADGAHIQAEGETLSPLGNP